MDIEEIRRKGQEQHEREREERCKRVLEKWEQKKLDSRIKKKKK